jgi:hypothetical protein
MRLDNKTPEILETYLKNYIIKDMNKSIVCGKASEEFIKKEFIKIKSFFTKDNPLGESLVVIYNTKYHYKKGSKNDLLLGNSLGESYFQIRVNKLTKIWRERNLELLEI